MALAWRGLSNDIILGKTVNSFMLRVARKIYPDNEFLNTCNDYGTVRFKLGAAR